MDVREKLLYAFFLCLLVAPHSLFGIEPATISKTRDVEPLFPENDEPPEWTSDVDEQVEENRNFTGVFRNHHNFSIVSGEARGRWYVENFGSVDEGTFPFKAVVNKFQYSFHFPIYGRFGYFLGSSFGFYYEKSNKDQAFQAISSWHLPGVLIGAVVNVSPALRFLVGLESYMERLEGLSALMATDREKVNITMESVVDLSTAVDVFYNPNWGVRLEGHRRWVEYKPPQASSGIIGARLSKTDEWIAIGLVYHLF